MQSEGVQMLGIGLTRELYIVRKRYQSIWKRKRRDRERQTKRE